MEKLQVKTSFQESQQEAQDLVEQINQCLIDSPMPKRYQQCEPIDEATSPKPPMEEEVKEPETFTDHQDQNFSSDQNDDLIKDCPICLCLMTEPCRFPKQVTSCEHRICKSCMEGMYEQASKNIYTLSECRYKSISVTCPFCRNYSVINLDEDKDYVIIDHEYLALLLDAYEDEFRAVTLLCGGDVHKAHEQQYSRCAMDYEENNCTITFEIGVRQIINQKQGISKWQEFVRIKNKKYHKIIDKILYRVDFCINETNLRGIKNPIVLKTNDQYFRTEKRRFLKEKKHVEIAMQPLGGGQAYGTDMPDFLPVKLYFYKIKGLNLKVREIVHENLKTGENPTIEFIIPANRKELNKLL